MRRPAFLVMAMTITDVSARQGPTTGDAPVNGLRMYHVVHGRGGPVVLLHGAFMTITSNRGGVDDGEERKPGRSRRAVEEIARMEDPRWPADLLRASG